MAVNPSGLQDEDGQLSDWIEIYNPGPAAISLSGYSLTDSATNPRKWPFPAITLEPDRYLVIFASRKNRSDPNRPLHTNFQLSEAGEYLALFSPDGKTVLSEYSYPPQFEGVSFGQSEGFKAFFSTPTPGAANSSASRAGPTILPSGKDPAQPIAGPLTISVRALPLNGPVGSIQIFYRRMFTPEVQSNMNDNGELGDAIAGDGIWTGVLPETAFALGEMTRWRFVAKDGSGNETRDPPFRYPTDSPQYYGTVTGDSRIQSLLPVLHWFTANPNGAASASGSRGAIYYNGEFYDNVLFTLHGQSSSGFPKKSYNIDFNQGHHFRWSIKAARVADIDLLTNWADKSKVRHVLAYEIMRQSGVAAHFAYTVRVQQNGSFFSTADIVEDADETYLERAGLNKDGALYKVYANLLNKDAGNAGTAGVEKKTRKFENNNDLQALINGLDLTGTALVNYLYDNIDIARCVNMLAANSVIRNIDMHSKNWYIYRDTGRSGEWSMLPWDLDLSHGRVWNEQNTYFDNALYTDGFVVNGTAIRLVAELFGNPTIRAIIMRRIRTLSDRFLQAPPASDTPESELYYERRLNEQSALIDPSSITPNDAQLDFQKWGSWIQGGTTVRYTNSNPAVETMAKAIGRFKNEYLPARRKYIYGTQIVGRGGEIPHAQRGASSTTNFVPLVVKGSPAKVLVPANGDLQQSWTGTPANEPFNTTQWMSGITGVGYERSTGYESLISLNVDSQMRGNNSAYLRIAFDVADPAAIQQLQLRMKYDDGFVAYLNGVQVAAANAPALVEWNSAATVSHEANAAAFVLFDISDAKSSLRAGRNVLAIQGLNDTVSSSDFVIVPELYAGQVIGPTGGQPLIKFAKVEANPASGNQDEEYIQLTNPNGSAVDISEWRLTGAVEHTFVGGTVLPPGGSIYVTPNSAAFRARLVSPRGGEGLFVQGPYHGHLSNFAEGLALIDSSGGTNSTATYGVDPSDPQRYLAITELMYHATGDGLAEYIELMNSSPSVTLNLSGVHFTKGVEFDFTGSAITSLPPRARVLVVRDRAAFEMLYGSLLPIAGVFSNATALSNGGELLKLEDAKNSTIKEFTFSDAVPWPLDVPGYSIVLLSAETNPDPSLGKNWRSSARPGGTPGIGDDSTYPPNPTADTDGNGEPDLIDYAVGRSPGERSSLLRAVALPASGRVSTIQVSYPLNLNASGLTIVAQISSDLRQWEDSGSALELVSRTEIGNGRQLVTWRVQAPRRNEGTVFFRIGAVPR